MYLYICIESVDTISPFNFLANSIDKAVFPTAVGPAKTNILFFIYYKPFYTILLNFLSNSYSVNLIIIGLPCGQLNGLSIYLKSEISFSISICVK